MLTAKDRIAPVFTITATIQGNGFSGVAKTGENGFALDPKNTIDPKRTNIRADVSGGFYGKNAIEMGRIVLRKYIGGRKRQGGSGIWYETPTACPVNWAAG